MQEEKIVLNIQHLKCLLHKTVGLSDKHDYHMEAYATHMDKKIHVTVESEGSVLGQVDRCSRNPY